MRLIKADCRNRADNGDWSDQVVRKGLVAESKFKLLCNSARFENALPGWVHLFTMKSAPDSHKLQLYSRMS